VPQPQPSYRTIATSTGVTALHVAALWALVQAGSASRPLETLIPAMVLSSVPTAPEPQSPPARPSPQRQPAPPVRSLPRQSAVQPEPLLSTEAPSAPAYTAAAPPAAAPAPAERPAPAVAARIEPPSSQADYLQDPAPQYPPLSRRLGEQGKVLVRVLIGADGQPQRAELKRSSGFDRLDRAALDYVMRCRYVPGKAGGIAQAMWYDAPVNFILE